MTMIAGVVQAGSVTGTMRSLWKGIPVPGQSGVHELIGFGKVVYRDKHRKRAVMISCVLLISWHVDEKATDYLLFIFSAILMAKIT